MSNVGKSLVLLFLLFVVIPHVYSQNKPNREETITVPGDMKSALESLLPEARFAIYALTTSGRPAAKALQPPFRLIVYGDSIIADYEDNTLSQTTLKSLGKPFLRSTHIYILAADMESDYAVVSGSTELPGGFKYENQIFCYPLKVSKDSLLVICMKDFKSDPGIPGLLVVRRSEAIPGNADMVEVKFRAVTN